jgi:hypothetical protein
MTREQLNLFETQNFTRAGKLINDERGVDLSTINLNTKERKVKITPNRFIIYPTGETHPYGDKIPSLKGNDFPFIVSHTKRGTKILKPMIRPFWDYPIMCIPQSSEHKGRKGEQLNVMVLFHKLVGRAFFELPDNLTWDMVDRLWVFHHQDGKKWDYRLKNLQLVSQKTNQEKNSKNSKKLSREEILQQAKIRGLF